MVARAARVRSETSEASNSAAAPMIEMNSRPEEVAVSMLESSRTKEAPLVRISASQVEQVLQGAGADSTTCPVTRSDVTAQGSVPGKVCSRR